MPDNIIKQTTKDGVTTLVNEQREENASTFSQFATSEAAENRGRFTAHEKSVVVGSTSIPPYPQGPAWSSGDQEIEPPLGVDVNAVEPVGTPQEIEQSLEKLGVAVLPPGPLDGGAVAAPALGSSCLTDDVETAAPPIDTDDEPPRAARRGTRKRRKRGSK